MTVKSVYPVINFSREANQNLLSFLKISIITLISGVAISSRLFSVIRYESIIHEFDPWFNYRATKVLTEQGFYAFWNWFDDTAWYPLGRVVGGTIYPGLMITSALIWNTFQFFNIPIDIKNVCVLLAPAFSSLTAYSAYLLGRELGQRTKFDYKSQKDIIIETGESTGFWAALFIGIAPGYISRSVAGSYDNEAIAIFILIFTFYLWIKALKLGSTLYGSLTALSYFYMVTAWGGYAFIINILPIHTLVLILMGRFNNKLYIAYSSFYTIGTLASMQVPFVGFQPIRSSDHMGALGVFGLVQLIGFVEFIRSHISSQQFQLLLQIGLTSISGVGTSVIIVLTQIGSIAPWTGRFYSLFDTNYADIHLPIIASVSEHQPTTWTSFFHDLQMLMYLFPAGIWICFRELREDHIFLIVYSILSTYFAGVMIRLILTFTPMVSISSALIISSIFNTYLDPIQPQGLQYDSSDSIQATDKPLSDSFPKSHHATSTSISSISSITTFVSDITQDTTFSNISSADNTTVPSSSEFGAIWGEDTRIAILSTLILMILIFVFHCTWVTSSAYSSPSVVLAGTNSQNEPVIFDDFREAYSWLRTNTEQDSKIFSWWDYGYQIAGMADRTTLVDNNTWNNTHIAMIGKVFGSREEVSYPMLRKHDVNYVLIVFGGILGYSGDDMNKFMWMIKIAQGIWPREIKEQNYYSDDDQYSIGEDASSTMKNSLMYKLSYYRVTETDPDGPVGDVVRRQYLPNIGPRLDTLEEAFTSENWLVRIYKVKDVDHLGRNHTHVSDFNNRQRY
ncbi:dolichyl-diphosphooligosaccharide-protein glycosyltransferase [Melampsora americana]|nr:dolichyl-diphosphooligosaccharide-protein glycosyltransferase [Melampsora americana]